MEGDFCWSLTATDVHTQWTETRAIWNKGQHAVRERVAQMEAALPFPILGFDSDSGGEFLNWHLADYFLKRAESVAFTRKKRIYDQPMTPFERLKACPQVEKQQVVKLEKILAGLDPFALKETIQTKLRALLRHGVGRPPIHRRAA